MEKKPKKLQHIIIGEKAKEKLNYRISAKVIQGKGIEGDRYFYGQGTFNKPQLSQDVREISIISSKSLELCNQRLNSKLNFLDLRRNLVIENLNEELEINTIFSIGTAQFKIVRTCPPCRYLSRLLDEDIMKGLKYIGGLRASIIKSGTININDEIIINHDGK